MTSVVKKAFFFLSFFLFALEMKFSLYSRPNSNCKLAKVNIATVIGFCLAVVGVRCVLCSSSICQLNFIQNIIIFFFMRMSPWYGELMPKNFDEYEYIRWMRETHAETKCEEFLSYYSSFCLNARSSFYYY